MGSLIHLLISDDKAIIDDVTLYSGNVSALLLTTLNADWSCNTAYIPAIFDAHLLLKIDCVVAVFNLIAPPAVDNNV